MSMCYLDYAGSGLVREEIAGKYAEYCREYSVNPHGGTRQAEEARKESERSARRLLNCLGLTEKDASVIWTSGGTEALNLAIQGSVFGMERSASSVVDGAAHPAMLLPFKRLDGVNVLEIDGRGAVQGGGIPASAALAGLCWVNNESGAVQDLVSFRRKLDEKAGVGCRLLVDGCQGFGKLRLPWRSARVDMLAISSRKIGGPAWMGALIVRKGVTLSPMFWGGGQQGGLRPGTVDVVGTKMFADAAEACCGELDAVAEKAGVLSRRLWCGLEGIQAGGVVRMSPEGGSPFICAFSFPGYEGAVLKRLLAEREGVVIGTGSACSAESGELSHVYTGMGFPEPVVRGALRVSFGSGSTAEDVDRLLEGIKKALKAY